MYIEREAVIAGEGDATRCGIDDRVGTSMGK
jgi:hypothetical protein